MLYGIGFTTNVSNVPDVFRICQGTPKASMSTTSPSASTSKWGDKGRTPSTWRLCSWLRHYWGMGLLQSKYVYIYIYTNICILLSLLLSLLLHYYGYYYIFILWLVFPIYSHSYGLVIYDIHITVPIIYTLLLVPIQYPLVI